MGLLESSRPQWGYHVSHRQDALGELASLRRERGTVSARPLTLADHSSLKDVSVTCVPLMHYGASTKASRVFNSAPTFPGIDFGCDSLLSFCFYGLLETPRLLTTPQPYGNRRLVLAWSGLLLTSFRVETLDLCDLVSHLWLANVINEMDPLLCGSTAMSHNECKISEPMEPQEASPMKHEMVVF